MTNEESRAYPAGHLCQRCERGWADKQGGFCKRCLELHPMMVKDLPDPHLGEAVSLIAQLLGVIDGHYGNDYQGVLDDAERFRKANWRARQEWWDRKDNPLMAEVKLRCGGCEAKGGIGMFGYDDMWDEDDYEGYLDMLADQEGTYLVDGEFDDDGPEIEWEGLAMVNSGLNRIAAALEKISCR